MSVSIPASRVKQVEGIVRTFVETFPKPIDSAEAKAEFLSMYHPEVEWFDHAFHMHRVGHEAVLGLQKSFTHCNQPFEPHVENIYPTSNGAVLEQVWQGTCANDIVRPDGQLVVKANGKSFVCHVCMVIDIDDDGKITKVEEYYNRIWEDGIARDKYMVLKGASMKVHKQPTSL